MNQNFEKTDQQIAAAGGTVVFYGKCKATGQPVAMKYFNFTTGNPRQVVRQMSILKRFEHENLLRYYNYFESNKQTCIVSELAPEDLVSYIINKKYYCEDDARNFIGQLSNALEYLHTYNTPSLNIKTKNILYDGQHVKLADYALQQVLPDEFQRQSVLFVAPEQVKHQAYDNQPDVYSLGIVAHLLLTGRLPYRVDFGSHDLVQKMLLTVANGQSTISMPEISENARDFVQQCLKPISQRPNIFQLKSHPWLTNQAPVIPLMNAQSDLKKYQANLELRGGSSITVTTMRDVLSQIIVSVSDINELVEEEHEEERELEPAEVLIE